MFGVSVRSWQWSGTSAQQSVGGHVKIAATSRRSNQSQQKQRQQADTEDHEKPPGEIVRDVKDNFFVHCLRLQHEVRCAGLLFQPSSIDREASGIRDTYFQRGRETNTPEEEERNAGNGRYHGGSQVTRLGKLGARGPQIRSLSQMRHR